MKIEVITIGDELLSGAVVDTNFAWIGEKLSESGFDLHWHSTVADDLEPIGQALTSARNRSDVVIVTGGLGPTTDDITLESAAHAFGLKLVLNQEALAEIEGLFQKIGLPMTENNRRQAMLPEGAEKISNRFGTAPGCRLQIGDCQLFFLPGVPREMKGEFEETVLPYLKKKVPGHFFRSKVFRCFGLPEATLDQTLRETKLPPVRLAWRLSFPEVLIKISTTDRSSGEQDLDEAERIIRAQLGTGIYSEGDLTIEKLIGKLLQSRSETLAVAESCTGGLIAHLLTNVPGSSAYFERGVVTYSNVSKSQILGIDRKLLKKVGAVSSEVAIAMAEGIRKVSGTTYGIGVTGVAGPSGGSESKPIGTVHIAVAGPKGTKERKYFFPRDREWFKLLAAHTALHKLRRMIQFA